MSLLAYYRATLADGARPRVDFSKGNDVPPAAVRTGQIDAALAAAIVKNAPKPIRLTEARLTSTRPPAPALHVLDLIRDLDPTAIPGCLPALVRPRPSRALLEGDALRGARRAHLGQMGGLWPLAARQREAVHHAGALAEGELLAVAGPPGTGKTTLICSLVATRVVEAALGGGGAETPLTAVAALLTNSREIAGVGPSRLDLRQSRRSKAVGGLRRNRRSR